MNAESKTTDRVLTVQNTMLGIITAVMLGAVPWAYQIGNKVTAIEVTLAATAETRAQMANLEGRVDQLRSEMDWLRGKGGAKEP